MAIVWRCEVSVESYAAAGKGVVVPRPRCPGCGAWMIFWSGYWRRVRVRRTWLVWVRRARCRACRTSHALVPSFCLLRRLDGVEVIIESVTAVAAGTGLRPVAAWAGVAHPTARGWWWRHRERARVAMGVVVLLAMSLGVALAVPVAVPEMVALMVLSAGSHETEGLPWGQAVSLRSHGSWLATTSQPWSGSLPGSSMGNTEPGDRRRPP